MYPFFSDLLISLGASISIGTALPLKFHISMFFKLSGLYPKSLYTSAKRCKHEALSSSRFMYSTLPLAHWKPSHFLPSAIAIVSSMSAKDLPALLGPASNILWPCLSTLSIKQSASGGISPHMFVSSSGSGRSSFTPSIHSYHSFQLLLPKFVAIKNCLCSLRLIPGILDNLEGFLF